MARNAEKKSIDGITFEVTQLGFKKGRQLFVRLLKLVGPSLAHVADSAKSIKEIPLVPMIKAAVERLEDEDFDWIADVLGETTRFSENGTQWPFLNAANREDLFAGRLTLFGRWVWFALEVNYADFFAALKSPRESDQKGQTPANSKD